MLRPEERNQTEDDPNRGRDDRNASEDITRLRAKGAGTAHSAQRAGEATAATSLNKNEQNEK